MDKKIYCFFYYYPPLNSSEGLSAYKIFNFIDLDLKIYSQINNKDSWCYSSDDLQINNNVEYLDSKNWVKNAFNKVKNEGIDLIITRSMPMEGHKVGLKLKRRNKKAKWIAFFSDPFVFNSSITKFEVSYGIKTYFKNRKFHLMIKIILWYLIYAKIINRLYWNKVVRKADLIICNNSYEQKLINSKKTVLLPHSYLEFKDIKKTKNNKIVFSYVGSLQRYRNLDNYLLAINKINEDKKLSNKVQFQFVGTNRDELKLLKQNNNIKIIDPVNFKESIRIMTNSSWLINIDGDVRKYSETYDFLPCKFVDYISANPNVINISNFEKSPSVELIKKFGGINLKDDVNEIYECLLKIINKKIGDIKQKDISEHNNLYIANKLKKIIEELLKK